MATTKINGLTKEQQAAVDAAIEAALAQGKAEGKAEAAIVGGTVTPKVAQDSGAISFYGFGRQPITIYVDQWERMHTPEVLAAVGKLIKEKGHLLSRKSDSEEQAAQKAALRAAGDKAVQPKSTRTRDGRAAGETVSDAKAEFRAMMAEVLAGMAGK